MRSFRALLQIASASLAFAYPEFSVPAAGASVPGGTAFTVTWIDSGDAPSLSDLTAYQLFLYSGSNASPQQLYAFPSGAFTASSVTLTVPLGIGGEVTNAYFLGMISTAAAGGTITSYSNRFTITGMTGVFPAAVTTALSSVSGTSGPPAVNDVAAAVPAAGAGGPWGTPYNEQEGLTRYAPMQPVPPSQITATNTSPQWPTSSVVIASTFLPIPSIVTTLTQPGTFSVSSHANTAAPASKPTDDMQKFLNRWKD